MDNTVTEQMFRGPPLCCFYGERKKWHANMGDRKNTVIHCLGLLVTIRALLLSVQP